MIKLNTKGFSHFEIVFALLVVVGIAITGVKVMGASHAATLLPYLDKGGCSIRGRVWNGATNGTNPCDNTCKTGTGTIVKASNYNYCSKTESANIDKATCTGLGRVWLLDGCARRADRLSKASVPQCINSDAGYYVDGTVDGVAPDKCGYTVTCSPTFTPIEGPQRGQQFTTSYKIRNTSYETSGNILVYIHIDGVAAKSQTLAPLNLSTSVSGTISAKVPTTAKSVGFDVALIQSSTNKVPTIASNCVRYWDLTSIGL